MRTFNKKSFDKYTKKAKRDPRKFQVDDENADLKYLENLGCSVVEGYSADTTLLSENIDILTNPNIKNKTVIKDKLISAEKNFANENDPFYNLSEQFSQSKANDSAVKKRNTASKKVSALVSDLKSKESSTDSTLQTQTVTSDNRQTTTKTKTQKTAAASSNTLPTQTVTNEYSQTSTRLVNKT